MAKEEWTILPHCAKESKELYIVLTCDGASSVGQVGNEIAKKLTLSNTGARMCCLAAVAANSPTHIKIAKDAKKLVVINGCVLKCASNILEQRGIKPDYVLTISELGIPKAPTLDFNDEDVEKIVLKVLEDLKKL